MVEGSGAEARQAEGGEDGLGSLAVDLWGGPSLSSPEVEALLAEAGFANAHTLPGPPAGPHLVVGQRS